MSNSDLNNLDQEYLSNLSIRIEKGQELLEEELRLKAGIKWREEGERSSKFFLNLIKQKQVSRSMKGFLDENGHLITNSSEISVHGFNYYYKLYSASDPSTIDSRFFSELPVLDQEHRLSVARPLTIDELKATLKTCRDSTPGLDGIPYSFYRIFGNLLLPLILNSWNHSLRTGTTAPSHRASCITIIPKVGKDIRYIKNWRPITVAACDIKIITKALAIRVAVSLPSLISESQMAYVPGRDINFNNRILSFISKLETSEDSNLISFDAEKAYDSVSHDYLKKVLVRYGFPKEFIQFFSTLYADNTATVQINGHLSDYLPIKRGVKQGDALSCALFILAIDPLIRNIEANSTIPAIKIPLLDGSNVSFKTLAYADDIAVLSSSGTSLQNIFCEYERLYYASGLRLNAGKTELLFLSGVPDNNRSVNIKYLNEEICLKAVNEVKICGNHVSRDSEISYERNVLERITTLEKILNAWKRRHLSINGKMIIIKCFALSQITFVSQFSNIKTKDIKKIEGLCYKFIHFPERVKRSTLKLPKSEGGVDGIDIESYLAAIKIRQFFKANYKCQKLSQIQWNCKHIDEITNAARHYLYKCYRCMFGKSDPILMSNAEKELLVNMNIRLLLKPNTKSDQLLAGLNIFSYREVMLLPRGKINSILRGMPNNYKIIVSSSLVTFGRVTEFCSPYNNKIVHLDRLTSKVLQSMLKSVLNKCCKYSVVEKYKDIVVNEQTELQTWNNLWLLKNPIFRAARLKVLYGDIFCNEKRHRFGLTESSNCVICGDTETKEHQLFYCRNAIRCWEVLDLVGVADPPVNNYLYHILVTGNRNYEICKSVIFKMLFQIDRSKDLTQKTIILKIRSALIIEQKCKSNLDVDGLIVKLNNILVN